MVCIDRAAQALTNSMSSTERFKVNKPSVVWEDFNEEVVIVNLESGQYFSARDAGSEIWRRAANGSSVGELLQALMAIYDVEQSVAEDAIETFLGEARKQNLLELNSTLEPPESPNLTITEKRAFINSTLEAFSDMQDILLLDPIHEVDASGWPAEQKSMPVEQST
jgi:hypothetical protein